MSKILGIDPGARTGWALMDSETLNLISFGDIAGGLEGFCAWWETHPVFDVLVVEDFILRQGQSMVDTTPLDIIGWLHSLETQVFYQPPAGRVKAVPDNIMKMLGVYLAGKNNRNAKEAVRHILWYLKKNNNPLLLTTFLSTLNNQ